MIGGDPNLEDFVRCLVAGSVRFLIVGGHAVGVHSVPRATKDLDVWIASDPENHQALLEALRAYGTPSNVIEHVGRAQADEVVWFGRPPSRIDLIKQLPGVEFEAAWARRTVLSWDGLSVPVISRDDLIANKQAVGRPQDIADVATLLDHKDGTTRP